MAQNNLRLYRCCNNFDRDQGYILSSRVVDKLSNTCSLEELTSHILQPCGKRNVFYSFSPRLSVVREYKRKYCPSGEICFIDIDLEHLPGSIISIHPVFSRLYLMNLISLSSDTLKRNSIRNPQDKSEHTILGVLNVSQRSVSSWAHGLTEICIQADKLNLEVLKDYEAEDPSDKELECIVKEHFIKAVDDDNIEQLRSIIQGAFETQALKRKYILELVNKNAWFAA